MKQARLLTEESLEKLSDLCYWEDQRFSVMQRLRDDQSATASPLVRAGRSVHLKNLKAIKREIEAVRNELQLEDTVNDPLSDIPAIPDEAYQNLPQQLSSCCALTEHPNEKDMLLLSLLSLSAGHLPNLLAEHANGYYPCSLNIFLADGSGAGKQLAGKMKALVLGRQPGTGKSNQALLTNLRDEVERDGGFRKTMRLAVETDFAQQLPEVFPSSGQGQTTSLFERVFTTVPVVATPVTGFLSVLLTGDHGQFRNLSVKAGPSFYSPFLVYSAYSESKWQSNRPDRSTRTLSRHLAALMSDLEKIRSILSDRDEPVTVELTSGQWQMIDDTFAEKMEILNELGMPPELHTVNENAAIYTLKLTSICTTLRIFDEDPELLYGEYLTPDDDDVIAALWITDTCLKHAIRLQDLLPGINEVDARGDRYLKYYNILPVAFETSDALELAEKLEIPPRSAKRYLNEMLDENKVTRVKRGQYQKIT